jgi:hypothetical protein
MLKVDFCRDLTKKTKEINYWISPTGLGIMHFGCPDFNAKA